MPDAFHGPRSRDNARMLIEAAATLGYPAKVVKTVVGGYRAPQDVVDVALGIDGIEEGVTYPAPDPAPTPDPEPVAPTVGDVEKPQWPGGNREAWANYAKSVGIQVSEGDTRDDIKTLVEAKE